MRPGSGGRLDRDANQDRIALTGSAYDYIRNQKAEAENYFGQKPGDRTQAGATGGGPIVKNRFFVFGGYEALRSTSPRDAVRGGAERHAAGGEFLEALDAPSPIR